MNNLNSIDPNHRNICMPFHGDKYTIKIVDDLIKNSNKFIETGAGWGDTINYMATRYPDIKCVSCETDTIRFNAVKNLLSNKKNSEIYELCSADLLKNEYVSNNTNVIFWLDAHGSFLNEKGIKVIVDPVQDELTNMLTNERFSS